MEKLNKLAQEYNFYVIEDASHAIGGSYKDKKIGCCEYSDACVFSFHPVKIITTGEGGMVVGKDEELGKKIRRRCHMESYVRGLIMNQEIGTTSNKSLVITLG